MKVIKVLQLEFQNIYYFESWISSPDNYLEVSQAQRGGSGLVRRLQPCNLLSGLGGKPIRWWPQPKRPVSSSLVFLSYTLSHWLSFASKSLLNLFNSLTKSFENIQERAICSLRRFKPKIWYDFSLNQVRFELNL